jgi:hypothetical protein
VKKPQKRFFVQVNRECGDPIIELRDREQDDGYTLIAEFYPHGWTNAMYEANKMAAQLNGETAPSPHEFDNERIAELERKVAKLNQRLDGVVDMLKKVPA